MAQFSLLPSGEATEFADDIRQLFDELARALPPERRASSGDCRPSLDVIETDAAVEVAVDVAGVPSDAIRIVFRAGTLLVVGEKAPAAGAGEQFHLVEREFGRFARAIRLAGALDLGRARATLRDGELTIHLPKLEERRGRPHHIPVTRVSDPQA